MKSTSSVWMFATAACLTALLVSLCVWPKRPANDYCG